MNYPALKMATNVALNRLNDQVASLPPLLAEKPVEAAPATVTAPVVAAPPTEGKKRFWRGTPID
ncbi:MAG: hypothetical protein WDN28_07005 [Chthoniobacter sp.]